MKSLLHYRTLEAEFWLYDGVTQLGHGQGGSIHMVPCYGQCLEVANCDIYAVFVCLLSLFRGIL